MVGIKVVGHEDEAGALDEALAEAVERVADVFTGPPAPEPPRPIETSRRPTIVASALPASPIRRRPRLVTVELRSVVHAVPAAPAIRVVPAEPAVAVEAVVAAEPVVAVEAAAPIALVSAVAKAPPKPPPPRAVRGTPAAPGHTRPRVVPPLPVRRAPRSIPTVVVPSIADRTVPTTSPAVPPPVSPMPPAIATAVAPDVAIPSVVTTPIDSPPEKPRASRHHGALVFALATLGAAVIGLSLLVVGNANDGGRAPRLDTHVASEPLPVAPHGVVVREQAPAIAPAVVTVEQPARPAVPTVKRRALRRPAKVSAPTAVVQPAVTTAQPQPAPPATTAADLDSPFPR